MTILQAFNLKKSYSKKTVVNGITLEVKKGEIIGLLGPNGSGKTSTFSMLAGILKPDEGQIIFKNINITYKSIDARARRGLTYLPQEPSIFRNLTVEKNILAILELNRKLSKKRRQIRLEELLKNFDLIEIKRSLGFTLSGGERRRTEIARALAIDPELILLDEPFSGIDPLSICETQKIIRELSDQKISIIITEHNVREILEISDKVYVINQGEVVCSGTRDKILQDSYIKKIYLGKNFKF